MADSTARTGGSRQRRQTPPGAARHTGLTDSGGNTATAIDNSVNTAVLTKDHTRTKTDIDNSITRNSGDAEAAAARSVAINNGSTGTFSTAFNVTKATSTSSLSGTVSGNYILGLGNVAYNAGSAAGGSGNGGVGGGGLGGSGYGGSGGNGGGNSVSAGTFSLANTMNGVSQGAAGIMLVSQNSGLSSLVQQSVNVQANLSVGH